MGAAGCKSQSDANKLTQFRVAIIAKSESGEINHISGGNCHGIDRNDNRSGEIKSGSGEIKPECGEINTEEFAYAPEKMDEATFNVVAQNPSIRREGTVKGLDLLIR